MDTPPPDTDTATRPCAHCGAPVPQRAAAGRPFRYCRDNDGACQRASRANRMRRRDAPGLAGQIARSWELVDRLDQMVGTLTETLHAELSPAGVDRRVAEVRAEAAATLAAAQAERDDARQLAEAATTAATQAQQAAAQAAARAEIDPDLGAGDNVQELQRVGDVPGPDLGESGRRDQIDPRLPFHEQRDEAIQSLRCFT